MAGASVDDGDGLLQAGRLERQQLRFMLWKHGLQKRRGWAQTMLEILSPVLVMCALVYAYHKTKINYYAQWIPAGDLQRLPNEVFDRFLNALERSQSFACSAPALTDFNARLAPLNLTQKVLNQWQAYQQQVNDLAAAALINQGYPAGFHDPNKTDSGSGNSSQGDRRRRRGDSGGEEESIPVPPELRELVRTAAKDLVDAASGTLADTSTYEQLKQCAQAASRAVGGTLAWTYMNAVWNKGPQPAFNLDEYLLVSRTLQAAMDTDPALSDLFYSFKRDFGWNWLGNLIGTGKIAFTPDTPEVRALAQHLIDTHVYFKDHYLGILPRDRIEQMARDGYNFWAVVDFAYGPVPGGSADYTIRMALTETPETWVAVEKFDRHTSKRYKMYFISGFFAIEAAINAYVLGQPASSEATLLMPQTARWNVTWYKLPDLSPVVGQQEYAIWSVPFPKPQYQFNGFYQAVGPMLGLVMVLSMVFPLAMLIRGMVEEKETRQREVLCIMGLRPWVLHLSWIITYAVIFFLVCLLSVLVTGTTFLSSTSKSLLFTYLGVFCASELTFGLLVSTLFSKAKVSAIVGPLLHFAIVMPRYAFFKTSAGQAIGRKLLVCLLAPSAFTFGMDVMAQYEGGSAGMTWADVWSDPFPLGATLVMMALDALLYLGLAAYFDKVIPSGYGQTLPWTFPCRPRYWRSCWSGCRELLGSGFWRRGGVEAGSSASAHHEYQQVAVEGAPLLGAGGGGGGGAVRSDMAGCAPADVHMTAGPAALVDIRHLVMRYPNGVMAVRDLSLQMYAGQITVLLGHNGAGKSTTVAMMTGLMMPTSGDVVLAGHSIVHDTKLARQSLGLCPQHEVLINRLTVREHLILLAAIKGVTGWNRCVEAASAMRATVGLTQADEQAYASALSGGMKRKLQMGMALIGGSKVVVADEPTSGMDPTARRGLWALLRGVRQEGRAVLLTTHYMDEADLLGDNIVIMSEGRLRAQGTGLALKDAHGGAYTLSITLAMPHHDKPSPAATHATRRTNNSAQQTGNGPATTETATESVELLDVMARVCVLVEAVVPGAWLVRRAGTELALQLPAHMSGRFPELLEALEAETDALRLAHVSISMPTLEEVFLAVTSHKESDHAGHPLPPHAPAAPQPSPPAPHTAMPPQPATYNTSVCASKLLPGGNASTDITQHPTPPRPPPPPPSVPQPLDTSTTNPLPTTSDHSSSTNGHHRDPSHSTLYDPLVASTTTGPVDITTQVTGDMTEIPLWSPVPVANSTLPYANGTGHGTTTANGGGSYTNGFGNGYGRHENAGSGQGESDVWQSKIQRTQVSKVSGSGSESQAYQQWLGQLSGKVVEDTAPTATLANGSGQTGVGSGKQSSGVHTRPGPKRRAAAGRPATRRFFGRREPHWWRCFRLMVGKRAVMAGRDWKGLLYLFLLPVAAVALTLTILLLNVDPTGPRLTLSLRNMEQYTPVHMSHNPAPGIFTGCLGPTHPLPADEAPRSKTVFEGWVPDSWWTEGSTCPDGLGLRDLINISDSYTLSEWLLRQLEHNATQQPPQYAAVMWSDPVVLRAPVDYSLSWSNAAMRIRTDYLAQGVDLTNLITHLDLITAVRPGLQDVLKQAMNKVNPDQLGPLVKSILDTIMGKGSDSDSDSAGGRRLQQLLSQVPAQQPQPAAQQGQPELSLMAALRSHSDSHSMPELLQSLLGGEGQLLPAGPQQTTQLVAALNKAGLTEADARQLGPLLADLGSPASKAQFLDLAAGSDQDTRMQLTQLLDQGLPQDPQQLLLVFGVLVNSPVGHRGLQSDAGALDPAAIQEVLTRLVQDELGIEDPDQARRIVNAVLPVLVATVTTADANTLKLLRTAVKEYTTAQRIVSNMRRRFSLPPVTIVFNASAYHSFMGAFTDIQQALANIDPEAAKQRAVEVAAAGKFHWDEWQSEELSKTINTQDRTLRVTNHPLPLTAKETLAIDTFLSILVAILCMVPFCYLAGAYTVATVTEGASGSRALQISSGCPRVVYWAGGVTWDLLMHVGVSVVSLATFAAFGDAATTGSFYQALATFLLLLGFGAGCVPLSYCMSLGFTSPSSAQVSVSALNFLLGFMFVVASQTMQGIPECRDFQRVAVHFCRLLPPFNFGEGLISLSSYRLYSMLAHDLESATANKDNKRTSIDSLVPEGAIQKRDVPSTPFAWNVLGRNLTAMYGTAILYFLLLVLLDALRSDPFLRGNIGKGVRQAWDQVRAWMSRVLFRRGLYAPVASGPGGGAGPGMAGVELQRAVGNGYHAATTNGAHDHADSALHDGQQENGTEQEAVGAVGDVVAEDADVAQERRRVTECDVSGFALVIQNLRKVYSTRPPKVAVEDLCLSVRPGERFGFLGANGAGKSSTLRVLSGQAAPTQGDARVNGLSVISAAGSAAAHQKLVGYCPQVDPLLDLMTAEEQVVLYASLKGVEEWRVAQQAEELLVRVGLPAPMWHRGSGTLSGGNKRKVSLAIALVGQPALVLLDEPSSGMDPGARRLMWDAILRATEPPQAILPASNHPNHHRPTKRHRRRRQHAQHGYQQTGSSHDFAGYDSDASDRGSEAGSDQEDEYEGSSLLSLAELGEASGRPAAALLLTTHYLEEAEALCERVGIMSKGRLMCLGTPQHLKLRFGAAYAIELRFNTTAQEPTQAAHHDTAGHATDSATVSNSQTLLQEYVVSSLSATLPGLTVVEVGWGLVRCALPIGPNTPSMSTIFRALEQQKSPSGLLAYAVSQPSLENVFLRVCGHKLDEYGEYDVGK